MRNKIPILHIDIDIPAFECQFQLRAVQVQRSTFNGHGSLGQKIQIDQLEGHGHRAQKKHVFQVKSTAIMMDLEGPQKNKYTFPTVAIVVQPLAILYK